MEQKKLERLRTACQTRIAVRGLYAAAPFTVETGMALVTAALSSLWVSCGERLPTMEDADTDGMVLTWDEGRWDYAAHYEVRRFHEAGKVTHWRTPPLGPAMENEVQDGAE